MTQRYHSPQAAAADGWQLARHTRHLPPGRPILAPTPDRQHLATAIAGVTFDDDLQEILLDGRRTITTVADIWIHPDFPAPPAANNSPRSWWYDTDDNDTLTLTRSRYTTRDWPYLVRNLAIDTTSDPYTTSSQLRKAVRAKVITDTHPHNTTWPYPGNVAIRLDYSGTWAMPRVLAAAIDALTDTICHWKHITNIDATSHTLLEGTGALTITAAIDTRHHRT